MTKTISDKFRDIEFPRDIKPFRSTSTTTEIADYAYRLGAQYGYDTAKEVLPELYLASERPPTETDTDSSGYVYFFDLPRKVFKYSRIQYILPDNYWYHTPEWFIDRKVVTKSQAQAQLYTLKQILRSQNINVPLTDLVNFINQASE